MTRFIVAAAFLFLIAGAVRAQAQHPCAADASAKAWPLLQHHFLGSEGEKIHNNYSVGVAVKTLPPIRALKGSGRFDVLEIWGYIYKAEYRMRFIYAQIKGSCVLMGQEIIEASNPY